MFWPCPVLASPIVSHPVPPVQNATMNPFIHHALSVFTLTIATDKGSVHDILPAVSAAPLQPQHGENLSISASFRIHARKRGGSRFPALW